MASESQGDEGQPRGDKGQVQLVLVPQMAEALTAISLYLETAVRLLHADTPSGRTELLEVVEKGQGQAARARAILQEMRDLLLEK